MQVQAYSHGVERGCIGDEEVCSQAGDHFCCWQARLGNSKVGSHETWALHALCEPELPVQLVQVSKICNVPSNQHRPSPTASRAAASPAALLYTPPSSSLWGEGVKLVRKVPVYSSSRSSAPELRPT